MEEPKGDGRRVLVTGAAGFIGIPTVRGLLRAGYSVTALDNFSVGSRERLAELAQEGPLDVAEADLRNAADTRAAVLAAEPWGVVHLAAIHFIPYCVAHPAEALAVNVQGTQHLLEALPESGAERLVIASTGDVYLPSLEALHEDGVVEPNNVYGASKLMCEWLVAYHRVQQPALTTVTARLFNAYGPGETNPHVLPDILADMHGGDTLHLGNVDSQRDYVYVEDMARALRILLSEVPDSVTVNVGTGTSRSVRELVEQMAEITGRPLEILTDPAKLRKNDRPVLRAHSGRLRELLPGFEFTDPREALTATLQSEGLLATA